VVRLVVSRRHTAVNKYIKKPLKKEKSKKIAKAVMIKKLRHIKKNCALIPPK